MIDLRSARVVALPGGVGKLLLPAALAVATLAVVFAFDVDDVWRLVTLVPPALAALFIVLRPHWGVLAMIACWMLGSDPIKVGPLRTVELLGLLLMIPFAMDVWRRRHIAALWIPHVWIVLGIVLVMFAATVWSELMHPAPPHAAFENTTGEFRSLGRNVLIVVLFATFVRTPRQIRIAAAVLLCVILVFAWDALDPAADSPAQKARAEARGIADQNRLGALCVWGTALTWWFRASASRALWRRLALIPLGILPFVGLLTASRSMLLQLAVLVGLIILEQHHRPPAERVRSLALAGVIGFVLLVAAPHTALLRMTSFDADVSQPGGDSTRRRMQTAWTGVIMAAEHPILGVGPGNFRWRIGRDVGPHNSYLWALTDGGPLLLALYVLLLCRTYKGFRLAEQAGPPDLLWLAKALRMCTVTFVLFSLFADVWLQPPLYWLVGMSAAIERLVARPA